MSEKSKNILLGVLIVGLVSMTVAYAALSTSLNISGNATVAETKWNVRIEGWTAASVATGSTTTGISTGTSSDSTNVTKIENFTATLNKPGDSVTYNFQIANRGTITAVKNSFSTSFAVQYKENGTFGEATTKTASTYGTLTTDDISYAINCNNDTTLTANNASDTCSLTISYNELTAGRAQPSKIAGEDQTVNNPEAKVTINADWQYVQQ